MTRSFSVSFTLFLVTADLCMAALAIRFAELLRVKLPLGVPGDLINVASPWWFYLVFPLLWILLLNWVGAYSPRRTYRAVLEASNIVLATCFAAFVFSGVLYLAYRDYSRLQAGYLIALLGALTLLYRGGVRGYFRVTGGRKYDSRRILVVGTGQLAELTARQIRAYAWTGLYLAGFVRDRGEIDQPPTEDKPVFGTVDQIGEIIQQEDIDEVVLALRRPTPAYLEELVLDLHERGVRIRLAPDIRELAYLISTVEDINGLVLIGLRDPVLTSTQRMLKRAFDLVLSALLLVPALPLMGLIALVIRLDSPGSPIFLQQRVGEGMRTFQMYKFRTMIKDAEKMQEQVTRINEAGQIIHKSHNDPRVTHIGRFLRRTSLDELPQLFNVLKGDMSLVGPRPELPWMVEKYESWQKKRFEVPQGITGWWQINRQVDSLMHLNVEDDLYYIINYSMWLDFNILVRTVPAVLSGRGAY